MPYQKVVHDLPYSTAKFELTCYEHVASTLELTYVERSPDPWYSDREVSIQLTAADVDSLIDFLNTAKTKMVTNNPLNN